MVTEHTKGYPPETFDQGPGPQLQDVSLVINPSSSPCLNVLMLDEPRAVRAESLAEWLRPRSCSLPASDETTPWPWREKSVTVT